MLMRYIYIYIYIYIYNVLRPALYVLLYISAMRRIINNKTNSYMLMHEFVLHSDKKKHFTEALRIQHQCNNGTKIIRKHI